MTLFSPETENHKGEGRFVGLPRGGRGTPAKSEARGFSLIELLTVIAVMGVIMALALPAIGGLRSAGAMNHATTSISLLLEQARSYAMANNTYVWVGFHEDTMKGSLSVAAVAASSGSVTDISSPNATRPIIRPQSYENLQLHAVTGIPGMEVADGVTGSDMATFQGRSDNVVVTFEHVVQFGPMGACRIKTDNPSRWVQLGIQPTHGGNEDNQNVAAVQIAGLTGQVRVFRP